MPISERLLRRLPHLAVAAISIVALILIALAHRYMPPQASHLLDKIIHSLHAPGFVGVTFFVFALLRLYRRGPRNYLYAAAITMGIGVLAEISQIPGPRDAEFSDLVVDAIGITASLGLLALFDRQARSRLGDRAMPALVVVTLAAWTFSFWATSWYGFAWMAQERAAPSLLTFESVWERTIFNQPWRRRDDLRPAPEGWPVDGKVARVRASGRRIRVMEIWPYPDWSDYRSFSFLASAPDGERVLSVTVEDARPSHETETNRFTKTFEIGPGPKRLTVPLDEVRAYIGDRPFDIAHVSQVVVRVPNPGDGAEVLLDDFRLE